MSKLLLVVKGDWNDGDNVYEITELTIRQFSRIQAILVKMGVAEKHKGKSLNGFEDEDSWESKYPNLTDDEIEFIGQFVPHGYEQDCHTINSVEVYEIGKKYEYI